MIRFKVTQKTFGNLTKLVFWSISKFKNWSFAKLLSFCVCQFFKVNEKVEGKRDFIFQKIPASVCCIFGIEVVPKVQWKNTLQCLLHFHCKIWQPMLMFTVWNSVIFATLFGLVFLNNSPKVIQTLWINDSLIAIFRKK